MKSRWLAAILLLTVVLLLGCGSGGGVTGTCASGFAVQFRITAVKDSLPLDSLFLQIVLGKNDTQYFAVNLNSGVSSAAITAAQGDAYKLNFKLYTSGVEIGTGESKGTLKCDLDVALDPKWDVAATDSVKKNLDKGNLLPAKLSLNFTQAVAGRDFELPLEPLSKDSVYRWYLKLGDSTLIQDQGQTVRIPIADSLAGKTLVLRLQVVVGKTIKEDRIWVVTVLAAPPLDRIARIRSRSDTTVALGVSLALRYADNRLSSVETYDSLVPGAAQKPVGVESLYYDDKGRLSKTTTWESDSARIDSLFGYGADGRLAALDVRKGSGKVVDSLFYDAGKLSSSRRYVDGALWESAKYKWTASASREDSVFTIGPKGLIWTRLIENAYKNDSLVLRQVLIVRDGLQALGKEVIAYNALGGRAYREVYSEGKTPTLEQTDSYGYDAKGRLASMLSKDEVTGNLLYMLNYEYGPASPKVSASVHYAAGQGAEGSFGSSGVNGASGLYGHNGLAILGDIRFTHSEWDYRRPVRHLESGR